jgi:hypothetical protein
MPEISRFYGIVIRMNFNEHPPAHFHAYYGEDKASIEIATGEICAGRLAPRAYRLVREWWELHRAELEENWQRVERGLPLVPVSPL